MQDSREKSAKVIYTSVEIDIHLEPRFRIKRLEKPLFEEVHFNKLNSSQTVHSLL